MPHCMFCSYSTARSDHLRKHYQRHHPTPASVCDGENPRAALHPKNPNVAVGLGNMSKMAYCWSCWHAVENPGQVTAKTGGMFGYVDRHHTCKEKQERPDRRGVAPANKKSGDTHSQEESIDLQETVSDSKIPEIDMLAVFDQCMSAVTKMRLPAERLVLREKLRTLLRACQTDNTDEETGKVDWPNLFVDFTRALATEYAWTMPLTAQPMPAVIQTSVSVPASAPVTPAPPVAPTQASVKPFHDRQTLAAPKGGRELR